MGEIVVIGGGGHAKVLICVLKKTGWNVLGYTDPENRGEILGAPYLGGDDTLAALLAAHPACRAIVGVGTITAGDGRLRLQRAAETLGFEFAVVVSPQAVVNEEVTLGRGTVVFDGVVVNSGTIVGECCILNTNTTVEHDCRLGDNVHVAPGATVSGGVTIGDNCLVGVGAGILQGVTICPGCLIGMGAAVVAGIAEPGAYAGVPARRIS